jgi:FKBP-type peptidyl-prolyl cis-trans isomerase SlyD
MAIKQGDFVEIDYIGRIKGTGKIFDTTLKDVAKKEGLLREGVTYKPSYACVGAGHVLKGIDEALEGKNIGDEFEIDIEPEKAFGKRNPGHIQITSSAAFKNQEVKPVPGMQFSVDGAIAIVKSVSGGRVILDFNHPLAGRSLKYWVKINKKVEGVENKTKALIHTVLGKDVEVKKDGKKLFVELDMDKLITDKLKEKVKELVPESKDFEIVFEKKKLDKK